MNIGKLTEIDVRDLWRHEQYDFSAWLARAENLELLNEILGLTLVEANREVYVGAYRCDLVAKDEATGNTVIIENQLEVSNHDHLGKIITYASGLNARAIVWIVKEAREEHKSAIEWLNNNTNEAIGFFLLELHAYKIGDSLPAPKFEPVEVPNDFIKNSKPNTASNTIAKRHAERLAFWTKLNEVIAEKGKPFNIRKPTTDHWYDVSIGSSDAHISITLVNKDGYIGVELYITDNKALYDMLLSHRNEIEAELSRPLEWQRLDNRKASRILYKLVGFDFAHEENHSAFMNKIIDIVLQMKAVFSKYIKKQSDV